MSGLSDWRTYVQGVHEGVIKFDGWEALPRDFQLGDEYPLNGPDGEFICTMYVDAITHEEDGTKTVTLVRKP